ncbi:BON domain-containing protein [uncultured Umboniibacter sp.]|uniref:BON domain-containing protein n=1 Tax=uncultured Umboniibacter sp. TaxID=1798917 RepID=UPI002606B1AD|nr:BON domain-containing protein [uncultured Umboniibacter sp.]
MRQLSQLSKICSIGVLAGLIGCTSIITASTDGPIENNELDRSFGRFIDDEQIETVVAVNIRHSSETLAEANISVVSYNGVVLLVGQLSTEEERERVTQIAREVKGVRQVHNQISISGAISTLVGANDTYLSAKVRSRFAISDSDYDFSNIKVVTENSVVYLMGIVTRTQADVAVDIARQTGGVQRIVKVFEYAEG